jgi:hypothetical protein
MTINQVIEIVNPLINGNHQFDIDLAEMNNQNGSQYYRQIINHNVQGSYGIYLVFDQINNEILYIGKGGTLKNDGTFKEQNLNGRLLASRGAQYSTSHEYFKHKMNQNNYQILRFYIFYSNQNIPPSYLESILLYNFYNINNCLPILNNEF